MDNFYTVTVYEKGAEIIRVYHTLLGKEGFRYRDLQKQQTKLHVLASMYTGLVRGYCDTSFVCCVVCFGVLNVLQPALNCSDGIVKACIHN